jgi:hypothetical protein
MWPVAVVMPHEDVEDPQPQRHAVRLRRAKRRANDLEPSAAKHDDAKCAKQHIPRVLLERGDPRMCNDLLGQLPP